MSGSKRERIDVLNPTTNDWIQCVIDLDRPTHVITVADANDATVKSSFALVSPPLLRPRTHALTLAVVRTAGHHIGSFGRAVQRAPRTHVRLALAVSPPILTLLLPEQLAAHCRCAAATRVK